MPDQAAVTKITYGAQVPIFPVESKHGLVWMEGRPDIPWQRAYVVWCRPSRLEALVRHTTRHQWCGLPPRWSEDERELVHSGMTSTTAEEPMPVGCLHLNYLVRRMPAQLLNFLESRGLHSWTVELRCGFMDGMHRTAWLIENGAPLVPIMTTSLASAMALEQHAGDRLCHIDLGRLEDEGKRPRK
ncbi:plasmid fertility inhibition factor family protein [Belnapia rosea]|uniref:plasmid fertility inhibition factor family protein n=1 Tax=Belnapia rosea TaxID=938405 RepID=UPI00115FA3A6|nr:hypothetical protein [Belnapia rosea]